MFTIIYTLKCGNVNTKNFFLVFVYYFLVGGIICCKG